ncbi:autotransporter outer membrane beta-barrel domain-containing protein [Bradyrhizobium forestalis]|uniref:autotransporter outer membrane beta-barrel domain-containing protein n=1 Tax=Bradyrhizobium forestalis TaxID=1419263 RepID=UPI001FE00CBB|nr:autotransporter outer membrane beta-barrel domain-containing protein [Bradyrhizobium forestalis]
MSRRVAWSASASVLALVAFSPAAHAACTPAAADNVIATCSGVSPGYGSGTETGVTVTVLTGATVSGVAGINVADGTFINETGATISGVNAGINAALGDASVTNSGSITGSGVYGILGAINVTVTNNAGASITGGGYGVVANAGFANVTNSGSIKGGGVAIYAGNGATVTNNVGAGITGDGTGIFANSGVVNVTNSGSITGTFNAGIYADIGATATVINNAGGSITGGQYGIQTAASVNITNSGSIVGTSIFGISAGASATVINNAGASVTGSAIGIVALADADVTNSGSIRGTTQFGIAAGTSTTVVNNAGGLISGFLAGIRAVAGGSSVTNAGAITGGTAAIQFSGVGNTLTLLAGSAITGNVLGGGSDTFQLGGSAAASFDVSQLGAAAQYQGFGTFNKIGSSVWTLTGTSTFAGTVNVDGGTLAVNGDLSAASSLTVNAGGTLGGNGIVGTTLINGGTLAPGNSIGTLTVASLTMTAASTYLVQVSGASADKTIVTGAANLAGKVVVDPLARVSATTTYTIVSAGAVSGAFSAAEVANSFARNARLSQVGNDVLLTLDPGLLAPAVSGIGNVNQRNVAAGIDNGLAGGASTPAGFNALFALTGDPLLNALTQASGETATGSQQTTFNAMGLFLGVLTDPFVTGRNGADGSSGGAVGYAAEDGDAYAYAATGRKRPKAEREAYAAIYRKAPQGQVYDRRWTVWAAAFGGTQTTDGNTALGSNATTSRIAGATAGADYWFSPYTVAGFALAGGGTSFSVANGGTGRSDLFQIGAFVRHTIGPAYVTGALAYGWQDVTTDRIVTIAGTDHLQARFNANAYSGRLEGGYRFVAPWTSGVGITPYAAGQFTTFDLPAYAESAITGANNFALSYAAKSVTASRSELGLRADSSWALTDAVLTLRGRAAWAHDFNPDRNIAATFQTLPGASFVVNGAAQAHDAALTTASAEVRWRSGWSASATFEGEFSDLAQSYAGKGTVRYAW